MSGGDWGGYRAIADEAKTIALEEKAKTPVACPVCGTVLDFNTRLQQFNCPLGHWRGTSVTR